MFPFAGEPTNETPVTFGTSLRLPSTWCPDPAVSAAWVRSASVVPSAADLMLPPLRRIALAATLTPSVSRSSSTTVYSKNKKLALASPPVRDESATARVLVPTVRLIRGVPVIATSLSKSTLISIGSPRWYVSPLAGAVNKLTPLTLGIALSCAMRSLMASVLTITSATEPAKRVMRRRPIHDQPAAR